MVRNGFGLGWLLLTAGCAAGVQKGSRADEVAQPDDTEAVTDTDDSAGAGTTEPSEDPLQEMLDGLYSIDRMVQVDIELAAEDWEVLRFESRDLLEMLSGDCRAEPFGSPYTWFEASVTLDGQTFDRVEVRKKGFIGSLSVDRPGLKLDLGEFEEDWTFEGARRLTLNNSVSDPSKVRQCLTYSAFADAGLPAVRCGFARVRVNGEDLGIYVNVEPVKEPMLERFWGDDSGNLYEGTLADFVVGMSGTLEPKTNEDETDGSDIQALVDALDVEDDSLIESLNAHMDLDQFFTHWGMEVLTKHQDGYAANTNNFYIYADPSDGRFDFIPWGTDDTLSPYWWNGPASPRSVFASGNLSYRLYQNAEGQARYLERLQALLDDVWVESVLLERLERMEATLLAELGDADTRSVTEGIEEVRRVVERRRDEIERELASGPTRWDFGPSEAFCVQQTGAFELSLASTWGSLAEDWNTYGEAEWALTLEDESILLESVGATVGYGDEGPILLVGGRTGDDLELLLYFWLGEGEIAPGAIEVNLVHAVGNLYILEPDAPDYVYGGEVGGTLLLSEGSATRDAPFVATMEGGLYVWDL